MIKMKALYTFLLCLILSSCSQLGLRKDVVTYAELKAEKNYYDSIPHIKVRDNACPYRYFFHGDPYTGRIEDYYSPGHPRLLGAMKDGYAEGEWRQYRDNDSLKNIGSFKNGYVTGEWRFYSKYGRLTQKLNYKINGRQVTADTLFVIYPDWSQKEVRNDSILSYYPDGKICSIETMAGDRGQYWDNAGNVTADMDEYIKHDYTTRATTYYVARGTHKKAYDGLILGYTRWTDEQLAAFAGANSVSVTSRSDGRGFASYKVVVH